MSETDEDAVEQTRKDLWRALADGGEEVAGLLEDCAWEDVSGNPHATINDKVAFLRGDLGPEPHYINDMAPELMTAPTPEQMRALAKAGDDMAFQQMPEAVRRYVASSAVALMTAADEVERLNMGIFAAAQNLRVDAAQIARLRAVIENAPHGRACRWLYATSQPCTCWKADVL